MRCRRAVGRSYGTRRRPRPVAPRRGQTDYSPSRSRYGASAQKRKFPFKVDRRRPISIDFGHAVRSFTGDAGRGDGDPLGRVDHPARFDAGHVASDRRSRRAARRGRRGMVGPRQTSWSTTVATTSWRRFPTWTRSLGAYRNRPAGTFQRHERGRVHDTQAESSPGMSGRTTPRSPLIIGCRQCNDDPVNFWPDSIKDVRTLNSSLSIHEGCAVLERDACGG